MKVDTIICLREEVMGNIEEVPVVREAEAEPVC
jgi:hypothetical protein